MVTGTMASAGVAGVVPGTGMSTGGSSSSVTGGGGAAAAPNPGGGGQANSLPTGGFGGASTAPSQTGGAGPSEETGGGSGAEATSELAGAGPGGGGAGGAVTNGNGCAQSEWPAADPLTTGPFDVVMEEDVGPEAGAEEDDGTTPRFTMFRPESLGEDGRCHPVITWGNGTGATPNLYRSILGLFASHGFVVIASNNTNVAQGDPRPMVVGIDWVLEQNEDPSSVLYHHLDTMHIGATGHSQGAVATSQASGDPRIYTNVPIEGAQPQRNLSGPAMFFCGGLDDIVGCDGARNALEAVDTLPAMYAEYVSVDHGSWLGRGSTPSVVEGTINAWMRVHLMGDQALESWFYGDDCRLCTDEGWVVDQKNMGP